jgi:hypothetical protein
MVNHMQDAEIFCCEWVEYPLPDHDTSCAVCGSVFAVRATQPEPEPAHICVNCGHHRGAHFRNGCDADLTAGCTCQQYSERAESDVDGLPQPELPAPNFYPADGPRYREPVIQPSLWSPEPDGKRL